LSVSPQDFGKTLISLTLLALGVGCYISSPALPLCHSLQPLAVDVIPLCLAGVIPILPIAVCFYAVRLFFMGNWKVQCLPSYYLNSWCFLWCSNYLAGAISARLNFIVWLLGFSFIGMHSKACQLPINHN